MGGVPPDSGGVPTMSEAVLPAALVLAGVGSVLVVGLALVALAQRRSRAYLLVTLALATLLARTTTGGLMMNDLLSPGTHHEMEHIFDATMAVLLMGAIYYARSTTRTNRGERA